MKDVFGCIPAYWIPRFETLGQAKTAMALMTWADREGHANVGIRAIAQKAGVGKSTVQRALRWMEAQGWLSIHSDKQGGRSVYWAVKEIIPMGHPVPPKTGQKCPPSTGHVQTTDFSTTIKKNPQDDEWRADFEARMRGVA